MKKKLLYMVAALVMVLGGLSVTSCSNDDLDTNQYVGGISLNVWGPNPVVRGGTIRFLGSNLDQVKSVIIPGVEEITNFTVQQSGVPSEIRVTVPVDGPTVGYIKLVTNAGDTITTQTQIEYTENVVFESFSPSSVMPGDVVTITGDYLNLIGAVELADEVYVSMDDFVSQSRYSLQFIVPDSAQTGTISLYTTDVTKIDDPNDVSYDILTSDSILEVGTPTVSSFASPRGEAEAQGTVIVKQGETVTVTGTYLKLIESVLIGEVSVEDITVSDDGKTLTFTMPENAQSGDMSLVCLSGIQVPVGTITTVKPSNCVATPNPVKAGQSLTITGTDIDLATGVYFTIGGEDEVNYTTTTYSDRIVVDAVPAQALGDTLHVRMANGESVPVSFSLVEPTVTGYDNSTVSAGGALVINGTDLDLITSVKFGDNSTAVTEFSQQSETSISLTVPMDAQSGAPTLYLANGTSITGSELTIQEAVFCYVTRWPTDEIKAGSGMNVSVANGDKLEAVYINGIECQYVLTNSDTTLVVGVPTKAKSTSTLKLVSSNGTYETTFACTPAGDVETTLWTGSIDLGSWSINYEVTPADMFVTNEAKVGDKLRIYGTKTNDWWQVQLFDGHGTAMSLSEYGNGNNINSGTVQGFENGYIELTIDENMLNSFTNNIDWNYAFIIQGENFVLTKITLFQQTETEEEIWSGSLSFGGWASGMTDLSWGGYDWSTVSAGTVLTVYFTEDTSSDYWQLRIAKGDGWKALPGTTAEQYAMDAGQTSFSYTFTADDITELINNGGLVLCGCYLTITKVTLQ